MPIMTTRDRDPHQTAAEHRSAKDALITVVLADDHQVVRSGLRLLLESERHFEVVAETGDLAGTLAVVLQLRPRVLVLDLNMGGESALDIIPQLRADAAETQIVVLTMQDNPAFAQAALRAGAVGYVLKDAADDELMSAVELAAEGRTYLNPELGARLASAPPADDQRPDNLSPARARGPEADRTRAHERRDRAVTSPECAHRRVPPCPHSAKDPSHHARRAGRLRA